MKRVVNRAPLSGCQKTTHNIRIIELKTLNTKAHRYLRNVFSEVKDRVRRFAHHGADAVYDVDNANVHDQAKVRMITANLRILRPER